LNDQHGSAANSFCSGCDQNISNNNPNNSNIYSNDSYNKCCVKLFPFCSVTDFEFKLLGY